MRVGHYKVQFSMPQMRDHNKIKSRPVSKTNKFPPQKKVYNNRVPTLVFL